MGHLQSDMSLVRKPRCDTITHHFPNCDTLVSPAASYAACWQPAHVLMLCISNMTTGHILMLSYVCLISQLGLLCLHASAHHHRSVEKKCAKIGRSESSGNIKDPGVK